METSATNGSATVDVYASAADVYTFLTDLERLPTLSPENERCEFLGDATSIAVGTRFRGHNRAKDYTWHADCEVTVADPGRGFAYEVHLRSSTPRRGATPSSPPGRRPVA